MEPGVRQDRPRVFRPSSRSTFLLLVLGLGSIGSATALWTLGTRVTLGPASSLTLLAVSTLAGVAALALSRRRTVHPNALVPVRLAALGALLAALAFPVVLFLTTPGEVEQWSAANASDEASAPRRLRVLQFNVWHDYPRFAQAERRIEALEQALERLDADIVVLQEAWSTPGRENLARHLGRRLGLNGVYARANGSLRLLGFEEGLAVLSRFPLSESSIMELAPRKHLFDRRIALTVDVAVPHSGPVRVVATHLANGAPEITQAQTVDLLDRLESARPAAAAMLLAGDLNASVESRTVRQFRDANWLGIQQGDLDHLLLHGSSTAWRRLWSEWALPPDGSSFEGTPLSDHPAILAELEPAGPPHESRWQGSWESSIPSASAIDHPRIEQAVEEIGEVDGVESVLVVHDGNLVAERYFRGATPDRLQNMKSASKGVLSALIGIAIEQGHLALDDPISEHLAQARSLDDPRKGAITVRDLLSMKSGLESTSFGAYGSWASSRNWVRNALERPLLSPPGTRYAYSTGNTHLLSAVLTAATGQSALEFARQNLFDQLGIERAVWERDRQGIYIGGNNLAMTPRDMARFGLLYLDRGLWGERQIVPWSWVDESTVTSHPGWSRSWGGGYGYLWWLRSPEERGAYNASGFGGQYIFISRAEDLVVVVTSTEVSKGRGWRGQLFSRIRGGIVEAIRSPAPASE